jgi:hypothetical protein
MLSKLKHSSGSTGKSAWRRLMALASVIGLFAGLSFVFAVPASAAIAGSVYLTNQSNLKMSVPAASVGQVAFVSSKVSSLWYTNAQGSWTAGGITGESLQIQLGVVDTDLCLGNTVDPGTGSVVVRLLDCGANGTSWVACTSGDGILLYSRYFLDQSNSSQVVMGVNYSEIDYNVRELNVNYDDPAWFVRWTIPIPNGVTIPSC